MSKAAEKDRAGHMSVVAIIGTPNVGKSTLFNRLVGKRAALVEDMPGVTRDRNYSEAEIYGHNVILVDTGGLDTEDKEGLYAGIRDQCLTVIDEADLVLFVLDGRVSPNSEDLAAVDLLRRSGRAFLTVVNKIDGERQQLEAVDHFSLGVDRLFFVSALHGRGISDLMDAMVEHLPETQQPEEDAEQLVRITLVGKPNAGKSSLVNRLTGVTRMVVDSLPGTTRDPVDSVAEVDGRKYLLIDTAGIRRRSKLKKGAEKLAVFAAYRAMTRCDVAVLLVDAAEGPAEQDAKIMGMAMDRGRACVVALNKWDLVSDDANKREALKQKTRDVFSFAPFVPVQRISAITGMGIKKLLKRVNSVYDAHGRRVGTSRLNRLFEDIEKKNPPPLRKISRRPNRILYATQVDVHPPTFMVSVAQPKDIHFSYQRYVANRLREEFKFEGTPLKIYYRQRKRKN